ncbi:MAG: HEPN domain-containing protein [Deltaproteobacteria bacterium]|nr:HEPN domain-containing protein [Deltaproteobacteria bacterium]
MKRDEIVKYWIDISDRDLPVMESLFNDGHYSWSLYIGHLILEKTLKAYLAKNKEVAIPHIHHLLKLAKMAELELTEDQENFLLEVTTFNILTRYPDYKESFRKKATESYAEDYIKRIKEFRQWLIKKIER